MDKRKKFNDLDESITQDQPQTKDKPLANEQILTQNQPVQSQKDFNEQNANRIINNAKAAQNPEKKKIEDQEEEKVEKLVSSGAPPNQNAPKNNDPFNQKAIGKQLGGVNITLNPEGPENIDLNLIQELMIKTQDNKVILYNLADGRSGSIKEDSGKKYFIQDPPPYTQEQMGQFEKLGIKPETFEDIYKLLGFLLKTAHEEKKQLDSMKEEQDKDKEIIKTLTQEKQQLIEDLAISKKESEFRQAKIGKITLMAIELQKSYRADKLKHLDQLKSEVMQERGAVLAEVEKDFQQAKDHLLKISFKEQERKRIILLDATLKHLQQLKTLKEVKFNKFKKDQLAMEKGIKLELLETQNLISDASNILKQRSKNFEQKLNAQKAQIKNLQLECLTQQKLIDDQKVTIDKYEAKRQIYERDIYLLQEEGNTRFDQLSRLQAKYQVEKQDIVNRNNELQQLIHQQKIEMLKLQKEKDQLNFQKEEIERKSQEVRSKVSQNETIASKYEQLLKEKELMIKKLVEDKNLMADSYQQVYKANLDSQKRLEVTNKDLVKQIQSLNQDMQELKISLQAREMAQQQQAQQKRGWIWN